MWWWLGGRVEGGVQGVEFYNIIIIIIDGTNQLLGTPRAPVTADPPGPDTDSASPWAHLGPQDGILAQLRMVTTDNP